jgi:hypothetical protein
MEELSKEAKDKVRGLADKVWDRKIQEIADT